MTGGEDGGALLHRLVEAVDGGEPVVVATIVETENAAPSHAGTKMLVYADGRCAGSVGGGAVEARVAADALEALADGKGRLARYDLRELGMCAGEMTVYLEPQLPPQTVLVVGCGHIGRAVVELAHWLGYRVVAVDDRVELVTGELLPGADVLRPGPIERILRDVGIDERTHVVLTTRGTEIDLEALPLLLESAAASIGVLGSRRRWQATCDALLARDVPEDALDRVCAPIGLDLPAVTPRELALAILGEILATRRETISLR
ncbi:MAG TPA: XdhC/CoxI family protein [Gaiellaceae bacterium]|nr:XdhC/CoxI family protein [Gaiellaceae bacterium]